MSTPREDKLLHDTKLLIPESFIAGAPDEKILLFIDLVINDINTWPPYTVFDRESFPDNRLGILYMGVSYMVQLFKQMEVTLQDFNYNDSGLSVTIDQTTKLNTSIEKIYKIYSQQVEFMKKSLLVGYGVGLGSPRYQSQIGQFLKLALSQSFSWRSR
jgi:hypothetical protein